MDGTTRRRLYRTRLSALWQPCVLEIYPPPAALKVVYDKKERETEISRGRTQPSRTKTGFTEEAQSNDGTRRSLVDTHGVGQTENQRHSNLPASLPPRQISNRGNQNRGGGAFRSFQRTCHTAGPQHYYAPATGCCGSSD